MAEQTLLMIHAVSTWFMVGVIWLVQLGQYPLFARVGAGAFDDYYSEYTRMISKVVIPPMLIELITGFSLVMLYAGTLRFVPALTGFLLIVLIWLSTFLLQGPQHRLLDKGFIAGAQERLVLTNWVRTVLWSGRAFLVMTLI